ncbi:FtsX-like permease family protein [Lactobacillus xylocopicola]|uniref:ABC transporter permease n=1 Tax=Lactobacillus xylocopicola TaxID=2976676 RepID=A0ABN6SKG0_9LACO|nr:ABC transporter permease [Lactobacillus xylocopicola]BDR59904.1 ABC transporter permease [Lactobacillus xylocopicola]
MIWKLSLTGIRKRRKDYMVLFSGLVVASMIFYMFLTIATNPAFISQDIRAKTSFLNYIFIFGLVLLMIISFVYLLYANSFLLSMRQHDYGMFMMLGAKNSRIGLLIFGETLLTDLLAVFVGIVLGFGLTAAVAKMLIDQLSLTIGHFQVVLPTAILGTLAFFVVIFFLVALHNVYKLTHSQVIDLLHEDQAPVKFNRHPILHGLEAILGIVLLGAGYYFMAMKRNEIFILIPAALVTIVTGSYFIFNAFFSALTSALLKRRSFSYRGIRMFTLGQLKFRLHDYTRVLTMISLLFALALGAITVGLNFSTLKNEVIKSSYYDTTLVSDAPAVKKEVAKLTVKSRDTYYYKENKKYLYFNRADFVNHPIKNKTMIDQADNRSFPAYRVQTLPTAKLAVPETEANNTFSFMVPNGVSKKIRLLSKKKWQQLKGQSKFVSFLTVQDFKHDYATIMQIQKLQLKEQASLTSIYYTPLNKVNAYSEMNAYSSGFEFMGFFLGLAFLTMLASTLMFKVLSGARSDRIRYQMLSKMGTRVQVLRRSINWEIGTLFLLPALLGVIDVLFGLKLFYYFLPYPYSNIWIPFTLFAVLYLFYYILTVKLYEKIVLQ